MKRYVYDESGATLLRVDEEAVPVCGEDFCDECGDCLACYGSDPCYYDKKHRWIVYGEGGD